MSGVDISNLEGALERCPVITWNGTVWRTHGRKYSATDAGGSRKRSGRYHRAPDVTCEDKVWAALYFALAPEICLGEILRHTPPALVPHLNRLRITQLRVQLETVIDCRNISSLGTSIDALLDDYDYTLTQHLGATAINLGAEGLLVPSATRLGDNLVIFPDQLRPESRLEVVDSRDPVLYVERPSG